MEKLMKNKSCEILVIGAGITGLLTAYKFKTKGYDVMLIDKDEVGGNSTRKNTGLIQYSSDRMLHKMVPDESVNGITFYKDSIKSVEELQKISKGFKNKDAYKKAPSLYLASSKADIESLQKEYKCLVDNGFQVKEVNQMELNETYGIYKEYAILTEGDSSMNPYIYANELSLLYTSLGGQLYQAHLLDAKNGSAKFKGDITIEYQYIIYALGYDTVKYKPIKGVIKDFTYAFLCNPQIKTKDIMVWETARPYIYQNTLDNNKVVVGGGDLENNDSDGKKTLLNIKKLKTEYMKWYHMQSLELDEYYQADFYTFVDGMPKYLIEDTSIYLYPYGGNGVVYSLYLINKLLENEFNK